MHDTMMRWGIGLAGVFATLLAVPVMMELLSLFPLTDMDTLYRLYGSTWGSPDNLAGVPAWQAAAMKYGWFMLHHWIVASVIPVGFAVTWIAVQHFDREDIGAYLERLHSVETEGEAAKQALAALQEQWQTLSNKLDVMFDKANECWLVLDREGRVRRCNRAAMEFLRGYQPMLDSVEGRPLAEMFADYSGSVIESAYGEAVVKNKPWYGEVNVAKELWLLGWIWPLGDDIAMVLRDVSHRHRPEAALQSAEALVKELVGGSAYAIAVMDPEWSYLVTSRMWYTLFQVPPEMVLVGKKHSELMPGFPANLKVIMQQMGQDGALVGKDDERVMIGGKEFTIGWTLRPWRDAFGRLGGYILVARDNTEVYRLRQQIGQAQERENTLAYSDSLTGLPNRQLFNDRLNMAVAQAYRQLGKIALFFLDLDGFKAVNDKLGHEYGDMLLKEVALRLKATVRQTDTVARLGGDEFTIILGIRDRNDAEQVAKKLLEVIRAPYNLNGTAANVGTSIGIAIYPQDGTQGAELIRKADAAMYESKQSGKNTYRFATKESITLDASQITIVKKEEA